MMGVIHVRGSVIPVVNMRTKLGMPEAKRTIDTCVIVVELVSNNETMVFGALVDSVQEVIDLAPEQVEPPPAMGIAMDTAFVKGIGKRGEQFIIIIDNNAVFSTEDLSLAQETEKERGG